MEHWKREDPNHNAYVHYGIRKQRYKLIYLYNEGFDLQGTNEGGEDRQWELFNLYHDPEYALVVEEMTQILNDKTLRISNQIEHQ